MDESMTTEPGDTPKTPLSLSLSPRNALRWICHANFILHDSLFDILYKNLLKWVFDLNEILFEIHMIWICNKSALNTPISSSENAPGYEMHK